MQNKQAVANVFVPYGMPDATYVRRETYENKISHALQQTGAQLLLTGASSIGKTTLIKRVFKMYSIEHFVEICLDKNSTEGDIYKEMIAQMSNSDAEIARIETDDIALVRQRAKTDFRKTPIPIVIDDARSQHSEMLANIIKRFNQWAYDIDEPLCTLLISGVGISSRDLMEHREAEVPRFLPVTVDRFTDEEIEKIIRQGCKTLGVRFSDKLVFSVVEFSNGLPKVCQHICSLACFSTGCETDVVSDIYSEEVFEKVVEEYAEIMLPLFERDLDLASALQSAAGVKGWDILQALAEVQVAAGDSLSRSTVGVDDLTTKLGQLNKVNNPESLRQVLSLLAAPEGGELITYDHERDTANFREPLMRFMLLRYIDDSGNLDWGDLKDMTRALVKALKPDKDSGD